MANESEPSDFDKILKDALSPSNSWGGSGFGLSAPLSDRLDAVCRKIDELANGESANESLKNIYKELATLALQVRELEQSHDVAQSEHNLQMDLERENQRRLQR